MIGDLLINFVYWLVSGLISLFPISQGFPPEAHEALQSLGGYFGMFDALMPIDTLLTVLTLVFTIEIAVFGFRSLKWILAHLPYVGGKG